jgi:hypothetical protein
MYTAFEMLKIELTKIELTKNRFEFCGEQDRRYGHITFIQELWDLNILTSFC